jgi:hypothetical protein
VRCRAHRLYAIQSDEEKRHKEGRRVGVLTVLSSLFSGVVGALLVFWLGTHREMQNARERRDEERKALWRLVDMEIYQNRYKLEIIRESPNLGQLYDSYSQLHIETWQESKARLAQLLSPERIEVLVKYYGLIQRLGVSLHDEPFKPDRPLTRRDKRNPKFRQSLTDAETSASGKKNTLLAVYARDVLKYGDEARQFGGEYIGEVPDYFRLYEEEATDKD